jgi:hypothetical protein
MVKSMNKKELKETARGSRKGKPKRVSKTKR